jgi:hypothetical protein
VRWESFRWARNCTVVYLRESRAEAFAKTG